MTLRQTLSPLRVVGLPCSLVSIPCRLLLFFLSSRLSRTLPLAWFPAPAAPTTTWEHVKSLSPSLYPCSYTKAFLISNHLLKICAQIQHLKFNTLDITVVLLT